MQAITRIFQTTFFERSDEGLEDLGCSSGEQVRTPGVWGLAGLITRFGGEDWKQGEKLSHSFPHHPT